MNIDFAANKALFELIKEKAFRGKYFILVLIVNGTESHGKNLMS